MAASMQAMLATKAIETAEMIQKSTLVKYSTKWSVLESWFDEWCKMCERLQNLHSISDFTDTWSRWSVSLDLYWKLAQQTWKQSQY